MEKVDQAFIQYPQHRPNLTIIQPEHIPIIDLSPITNHTVSHPSPIEGLVKEIGNACKEWGFFQVINHGVSLTLRQNIEKASKLFFAQSLDFLAKDPTFVPLTSDEHDNRLTQWTNPSPQYPPHFRYLLGIENIFDPCFIFSCNSTVNMNN